ncbi:MAG: RHS repeat protein [Oligoflexia bacterium]|nr:RHS repeat protein [Oligoflexia bacterium]
MYSIKKVIKQVSKMMPQFFGILGLLLMGVLLLPQYLFDNAFALVNLKNGNLTQTYADLVIPGGPKKLEIIRTFNSKSTVIGYFGFGWCSEMETTYEEFPDGSVVIHEHGSGGDTRFAPREGVNNNIRYSTERGLQEFQKNADGTYTRKFNDGRSEVFGPNKHIIKLMDKSGYYADYTYKENGQLESIKDSIARQIYFSWFPDGKIQALWASGDEKKTKATYKYDSDNNLIESSDSESNVYKYTYDPLHNLTKITYSDGTATEIKYDPKTQFVVSVKDRNGVETKYKYDSDPKNPDLHYWTTVTKLGPDGKPTIELAGYEMKKASDGRVYTYRTYSEIGTPPNVTKSETIIDENSNSPSKITKDGKVTDFKYNKIGLLTDKISSTGEKIKVEYDDNNNKISRVESNDGHNNIEIIDYKYDKKSNLIFAKNNKGLEILLDYDYKDGLIKKMTEFDKSAGNKKQELYFTYNAMNKPSKIEVKKVGTINITYNNDTEVKEVTGDGEKVTPLLTNSFGRLMTLVSPSKLNFN